MVDPNKPPEGTNPDELPELENTELDGTEDADALKEKLTKESEAKRQIHARAKKAEADLKKSKADLEAYRKSHPDAPVPPAPTGDKPSEPPSQPPVDVDERILKSQGMDDELLKQLKDIAKLRGVSLIDAQSDPLFVAVKEIFEKEQKQKAAALPASRGSGGAKPKKDASTPGLSRDEHKEMFKKAQGL